MNRVVFLSSILWASVGFGGVITEADRSRYDGSVNYGIIEFSGDTVLGETFGPPDSTTVAYVDLLGTAKSMDIASRRIRDGRVTGEYDVVASALGEDLGNGFTRFDFRGMELRNVVTWNPERQGFVNVFGDGWGMLAVLHDGSAPAIVPNIPERNIVVSTYYDALTQSASGMPIGGAWIGVSSETLDPPYGDGNGDGRVDISDFGLLKDGFSQTVTPFHGGDVTGDYIVDINDFGTLKQNFGWRQTAAVPEPSTLGLLGLGILFLVFGKIVPRVVVR